MARDPFPSSQDYTTYAVVDKKRHKKFKNGEIFNSPKQTHMQKFPMHSNVGMMYLMLTTKQCCTRDGGDVVLFHLSFTYMREDVLIQWVWSSVYI